MLGTMIFKACDPIDAKKGSMGQAKRALLRPASWEHTAQLPGSFQEPQKEFLPPGEAAKPGHAGFVFT